MSAKKPTLDSRIQALLEVDTLEEMRASLVPILHELAYHATITGGKAETLDKWHDKYTEYLYRGAAQDFAEGAQREGAEAGAGGAQGATGPEARRPPGRPEPSEVPASLRAILDREGGDSSDSGGESPDHWADPSSRRRPPVDEREWP